MKLSGIVCTVGDLQPEDVPIVGEPGFQLRLHDGRVVTVCGLTREECREAAKHFLDGATLTLAAA